MKIAHCAWCEANTAVTGKRRRDLLRRSGRAYCSESCKAAYVRSVSSRTMSRTNRIFASGRMRANNPMRRRSVREKMSATLRRIGHGPLPRGGNGRGLTKPQAALADALGWETEFVLPTRTGRGSGYPNHYKLDIAHPGLKIAIEVDGGSHNAIERRLQDRKKEELLDSLGWKVLRFSNREVTKNLAGCVRVVTSTISKSSATTTTS
ncbi:MAG: hypothetical protein COR54_12675 [Elusimicrobia bacterium CG22_combo_CG10-13_8_21_14_all_63_91]|nr:MAG: hypothetical protein COR54_12675 [Elusimicrobia bacterium CG22_combo_CG10-13_8_21_14_all_63_91]